MTPAIKLLAGQKMVGLNGEPVLMCQGNKQVTDLELFIINPPALVLKDAIIQRPRRVSWYMHLYDMNTPGGLIELLGILSTDQVDKNEIAEIIKRIFIFDYDLAKDHFDEAIAAEIFEPNTPPRFHGPGQIESVVTWLRENNRLPNSAA